MLNVTTEKFITLDDTYRPPIEKIDISDKVCPKNRYNMCYLLKNVLTPQECQQIIDKGEEIQFTDRGNGTMLRIISDDDDLAAALYKRIKDYLPEQVTMNTDLTKGKSKKIIGLNNRFRCGRYTSGDFFTSHNDVQYMPEFLNRYNLRGPYECSCLTLMVYLNSQDTQNGLPTFTGGATRFLSDRHTKKIKHSVAPEAGTAIVFTQGEYELHHDGEKVTSGQKYMIRTDVMYQFEK